jgi:CheY-like chemotaxis protein
MSIIREHGGNIEAETLPAGGTAFTVTLPIAVGQPPELLPAPADVPTEAVLPAAELLQDRTILVLDDEESIRPLLAEGLSAQGLQVDCVATVEEALTHLKHSPYDVLLCDLNLSSGGFAVDGRDAARRILEAVGTQKPAVIYMTGDLVENGQDAARRDLSVCLQKPFRISDVLALLRDVLATSPAETPHS